MASFAVSPVRPWRGIRRCSPTHPSMCARCGGEGGSAGRLPAFVPAAAAEIRDPAGVQLLRSLQSVAVATSLRREPLRTVHATARAGDGRGAAGAAPRAVVLLHGFDSSALEFRALVPLLGAGAEVFAPDLLGWGLTEKPVGLRYGPAARREHLRAYCADVVRRPATLVGASLGGAVAIDFARAHPAAVDSLVLVDAQAYQDRPRSALLNAVPRLAGAGADVLRAPWLRRLAIRMSYQDPRFRTEDALRMGALHCGTPGWREAAVDFILGEGYCVSEEVARLDVPTLVLWGKADQILPVKNAQRLGDDIPDSKVVIVENSGHSPHLEQPEITAEHILNFLAALGDKELRPKQAQQAVDGVTLGLGGT